MSDRATSQSDNICPPRRFVAGVNSGIWCQAVDGTARPYQISLLPLGGRAATNPGQCDHLYITLQAQTADVFFYFSPVTANDLDDTAINAAGVALTATTMATTMPYRIPAGASMDFRIERSRDQFIILKCAGAATATLRVVASSQAEV